MAFRIQHNIAAIGSARHLSRNDMHMNKSLQRLSSGYRINYSADDAAGMASSMRMRAEVASLKVASRNAAEATSLLQVAEGAMGQIDLILARMKELATQAASGNAGSDLAVIDAEATALENEVNRIVGFTEYSGVTLLDNNYGAVSLSSTANVQFLAGNGVEFIDVSNASTATSYSVSAIDSGAKTMSLSDGTTAVQVDLTAASALGENESTTLDFGAIGVKVKVNTEFWNAVHLNTYTTAGRIYTADDLGDAQFQIGNENNADARLGFTLSGVNMSYLNSGSALTIDLSTKSAAQTALADIDTAISYLGEKRGDAGALINRLLYASSNLAVSIENKTASESTIRDVDMAWEMAQFTKNQILVQAGTAMLAQANTAPQAVLSLIR